MDSLTVHKPNVHANPCSLFSASNSCMSLIKEKRLTWTMFVLLRKTTVFRSLQDISLKVCRTLIWQGFRMLIPIENDTEDGTLDSLEYMITRIRLIPGCQAWRGFS